MRLDVSEEALAIKAAAKARKKSVSAWISRLARWAVREEVTKQEARESTMRFAKELLGVELQQWPS